MRKGDVVALFEEFASSGVNAWAAGGWAVDALVGHQTRHHQDLDVAVDRRDIPTLLRLLAKKGFAVTADWSPSRLELTAADGRTVDVHPVAFADDGTGVQAGFGGDEFRYAADGFTTGTIDGSPIPCLSVQQQLQFREGYDPRPVDDHDVALLHRLRPVR